MCREAVAGVVARDSSRNGSAEADGARGGGAQLEVGDLVGGHDDRAALDVREPQHAVAGDRLGEALLDVLGRAVGVDDELSRRLLHADLDLHSGAPWVACWVSGWVSQWSSVIG